MLHVGILLEIITSLIYLYTLSIYHKGFNFKSGLYLCLSWIISESLVAYPFLFIIPEQHHISIIIYWLLGIISTLFEFNHVRINQKK